MLIIWLSKDTLTKEKLIIKKRKKKEQEIYDDECK
jgi:hypothetical protein